jgi:hypothetical protein
LARILHDGVTHQVRGVCLRQWSELTKLRTFTYIFLVDSAFVIFNKSPPRMVIEEMAIDLPSSDTAFQALTSEACFAALNLSSQYSGASSKLLLREAVQNLTQPTFTLDMTCLYANMNILSLFTILSGM